MSGGLDPTLGAILPLVGVAVGALLGGLVRYWLDERANARGFEASARLMLADLRSISDAAKAIAMTYRDADDGPTDHHLLVLTDMLQSAAWSEERGTLARGLLKDRASWEGLVNVVIIAQLIRVELRARHPFPVSEERDEYADRLERVHYDAIHAANALYPYAF